MTTRGHTESATFSPRGKRQADPEVPLTLPQKGPLEERWTRTPLDHDTPYNSIDSRQRWLLPSLLRSCQHWHPTTQVQFRSHLPQRGEECSGITFTRGQA